MEKERSSAHRGIGITTRSIELEPQTPGHRRFSASYSIDASPQEQAFLESVFDTPAHAVAHALTLAKAQIDQRIADSRAGHRASDGSP